MRRIEHVVRDSGLQWTADLADRILRCLTSWDASLHAAVSIGY